MEKIQATISQKNKAELEKMDKDKLIDYIKKLLYKMGEV